MKDIRKLISVIAATVFGMTAGAAGGVLAYCNGWLG